LFGCRYITGDWALHIDSEIEEVTDNKFGGNKEEVSTVGGDSVYVNKIHGWDYFSWARLLEE
jgi:hypothetical protein